MVYVSRSLWSNQRTCEVLAQKKRYLMKRTSWGLYWGKVAHALKLLNDSLCEGVLVLAVLCYFCFISMLKMLYLDSSSVVLSNYNLSSLIIAVNFILWCSFLYKAQHI